MRQEEFDLSRIVRYCSIVGASALLVSLLVSLWSFASDTARPASDTDVPHIIDTHAHVIRNRRGNPDRTAAAALSAMDENRVATTILLPPPFPQGHRGAYDWRVLAPLVRGHPSRFAFVAGGDSLNGMIQAVEADSVTPKSIREFEEEAAAIVKAGAVGFGEIAVEHFSSGRGGHPYESTRPDHPLLLALADIAAKHAIPIDLHMEAVPRDMPFPRQRGAANPERLRENISAFERLLAHNRGARIVWAHAGWDLTGERTVSLMRTLLGKHANLYMSIKLDPQGGQKTWPFDPDGGIRPPWLALLREFPDRFVIGSDQFFDEGTERVALTRKFIDALPPDIARVVSSENAKHIYRLEAETK